MLMEDRPKLATGSPAVMVIDDAERPAFGD